MSSLKFSNKGQELISMYEKMASEGYMRGNDEKVEVAFSDFELRPYRPQLLPIFNKFAVKTVLDYGCGGSDWCAEGFDQDSNQSAMEFFSLDKVFRYEPARDIDERQKVDCVVSFDVLEHIFIADVPSVLRDIFSYAEKLVALNVGCYPAAAILPNGENAHITIRNPHWWKGVIDSIAMDYPQITVFLICSTAYRKSSAFPLWNGNMWLESSTFSTEF